MEKIPEEVAIQQIESLCSLLGMIDAGIDLLRVRRSGEFATGQTQVPFLMITETLAVLGSPES